VESTEDVLEELNFSYPGRLNREKSDDEKLSLSREEKRVFDLLKDAPVHIDSIIGDSGLPASKIAEVLIRLEIRGLVREVPGKLFVKS
jgi:DNA processing protein